MNNPNKFIWHHSNGTGRNASASTQHHDVYVIDGHHKTLWPGFTSKRYKNSKTGEYFHCGYHFVIDVTQQKITQTRALYEEGAHCIGKNRSSIGVLIIGNYDKGVDILPEEANELIYEVWQKIKQVYPELVIADNLPHRKYATKSCYGNSLSDTFIQTIIKENSQRNELVVDNMSEQDKAIFAKIMDRLERVVSKLTQIVSRRRLSLREK